MLNCPGLTEVRRMGSKNTGPSSLSQVVACFVIGFAMFGFGGFAGYSWLFGYLHPAGWLIAVGVICMIAGTALILGGGFGGLETLPERRSPDTIAEADTVRHDDPDQPGSEDAG